MATSLLGGAILAITAPGLAFAQDATSASASTDTVTEVVVTGSRIRRAETTTAAPVTVVDATAIAERGFVQAGEALNQVTSVAPSYDQASGSGSAAGSGQQFVNLFGLGAGRTLTLVNGRRTVTSSTGQGDRVVDTNIIPTGLLERVDVVQAGGAAVYGSDAISGVVNYVLKKNFEGVEMDAQYGVSSRDDYNQPSLRATVGKNFADGRGNIAAEAEWSKTGALYDYDRPFTATGYTLATNSANTSTTDGIPALTPIYNPRFYAFTNTGVIFLAAAAPVTAAMLKVGGQPQQLTASGELKNFNVGTFYQVPFSSGGDGYPYQELAALRPSVERKNLNVIGHYDLTDHLKFSGELLYSNTVSVDPYGNQATNTVLNAAATGEGAIPFYATNPYLSATTLAALKAARPAFANGSALYLSKAWDDLLPTRAVKYTVDTGRVLGGLEGDFRAADRDFYWSVSGSYGRTEGTTEGYGVVTANFNKAVQAVKNSAGDIVCSVNADASTANDDAACAPLNIFGTGNVSAAARNYVTARTGEDYSNSQTDLLSTIGGDLVKLPGGMAKFSAAYEYRHEWSRYTPFLADQLGILGSGVAVAATSGKYHTHEFSGELLVPLVGGDFTLPLVKSLEFDGSYRIVDNSLAGREKVWGAGLQWEIVSGLSLRGSKSRNFRAPTLDQLFAPKRTALASISVDPCDSDRINSGPNPTVRKANCTALFAANPGYGSLATFQDGAENFSSALVTTGGNPNLKNEVSHNTTYGVVFQPRFVPGLTIVADRIEIDLKDGLSSFTAAQFLATCYDSVNPSPAVCGTFTRNADGSIATATSTTFNAGLVTYRGETYNVNYRFPLGRPFGNRDWGTLELAAEATHNAKYEVSVTGFDLTRYDDTYIMPDWVERFDVRYAKGPFKLYYSVNYLPKTKISRDATIESTPFPTVDANIRHNVSASWDFGKITLRGGVTDITDEMSSTPTRTYGDIVGRRYFMGLHARF